MKYTLEPIRLLGEFAFIESYSVLTMSYITITDRYLCPVFHEIYINLLVLSDMMAPFVLFVSCWHLQVTMNIPIITPLIGKLGASLLKLCTDSVTLV